MMLNKKKRFSNIGKQKNAQFTETWKLGDLS